MTDPDARDIPTPPGLAARTADLLRAAADHADTADTADTDDRGLSAHDHAQDELADQARYAAGVLDGLAAILAAGPAHQPPPGGYADTVRDMRAAFDAILINIGHPPQSRTTTPVAPGTIAAAVRDYVTDNRERLSRAITVGQQYGDQVDALRTELEAARRRIAELATVPAPADADDDDTDERLDEFDDGPPGPDQRGHHDPDDRAHAENGR